MQNHYRVRLVMNESHMPGNLIGCNKSFLQHTFSVPTLITSNICSTKIGSIKKKKINQAFNPKDAINRCEHSACWKVKKDQYVSHCLSNRAKLYCPSTLKYVKKVLVFELTAVIHCDLVFSSKQNYC